MTSPLLTLPNCLIVPHVGTATKQCRHETAAETIRNLMEALTVQGGGTGVYCNKLEKQAPNQSQIREQPIATAAKTE